MIIALSGRAIVEGFGRSAFIEVVNPVLSLHHPPASLLLAPAPERFVKDCASFSIFAVNDENISLILREDAIEVSQDETLLLPALT